VHTDTYEGVRPGSSCHLGVELQMETERLLVGHDTFRKPADNITRQALDWNPQVKWTVGVGKPQQKLKSIESKAKTTGMTWTQLEKAPYNSVRWWGVVAALDPKVYRNKEKKKKK
jgi:hypothetical protein